MYLSVKVQLSCKFILTCVLDILKQNNNSKNSVLDIYLFVQIK